MNSLALSAEQVAAVRAAHGPTLILAGAGSGKTRVITERVSFLVSDLGVDPRDILAVTFTNKAADEMRRRIEERLGPRATSAWIMTFHALCVRILRRHPEDAGLSRQFVIYDQDECLSLVKRAIASTGLSDKTYAPRRVLSLLSMQKNGRPCSEADVRDYRIEVLNELAGRYNAGLRAAKAVDFDDLLAFSARLLEESDVLVRDSQLAFRYILVDEYQDTNRLQYRIVRALAAAHKNITVVGDEDQSIYSWRGADLRNILEFERDFPGAAILRLEENYRSTQSILDAASGLVVKNENRIGKTLRAMRPGGRYVESLVARDEYDEASRVAADIQRGGDGLRVACLYRMNSQSRALEEALAGARIRYQVVGAVGFYARREIRDVLSYLRLTLNPDDDSAFRRVVNVPPRGVGEQTLAALTLAAQRRGVSLFEGLLDVLVAEAVPTRTRAALSRFASLVSSLRRLPETLGPGALVEAVIEKTGYEALIDDEPSPIREDRLLNLKELRIAATDFEEREGLGLREFLDRTFLLADADSIRDDAPVLLMTLHAAKGLEFDTVFLVGMEEGLIPHMRAVQDSGQMEEERRLCYVGMTRARNRLVLTRARERSYFGDRRVTVPSRFLSEIPPECFEGPAVGSRSSPPPAGMAAQETDPGPTRTVRFRPGQSVVHDRFGYGTVLRVEGGGEDAKLTVSFQGRGATRLLAKFAGLKPA
ncbi:MAG: UvrD-helicase domain-containing protein [Vicinamibacteria bacterium]|nr:UvrD-helicase domain-containing protein [Vicinamibacteria bacterium]